MSTVKNFTRFFDKSGSDMNLKKVQTSTTSLYDKSKVNFTYFTGTVYFPKVSVNLIESENLFILQEVTGPTSSYELRKIKGEVNLVGGNSTVTGNGTVFTDLVAGSTIKIKDSDYTISSISGATSMAVSPTPSVTETTSDIYLYDYLSYSQPRSAPNTYSETVTATFTETEELIRKKVLKVAPYQLYFIDYEEDAPYITKSRSGNYELVDGSSDTIDSITGRIQLSDIETSALQINLMLSSPEESIYEDTLILNTRKEYREPLVLTPAVDTSSYTFYIGGTSHDLYSLSKFYLQTGNTGSTGTQGYYSQDLTVLEVGITGANTYIKTSTISAGLPVTALNYSGYRITWVNTVRLADLKLYGETEAEDERLKVVLQNFGKKIDHDQEYIFRESDIDETLPNYRILNNKRKELLLEGDNIYPYLGSYRALINIVNFFGYYDLRIKEYFLNVDTRSSNYGKYLHLLVPRDNQQREDLKAAWRSVPSKIYKKTSLFGLFYDLNKTSGQYDDYGIPVVEDAFDFSPDEVLIKLFGLKELLKNEYLPLNARIYDITGEGIYFERFRIDSWSDNLHHLTLDLGARPVFNLYPESESYITDLRRIDSYYVQKFAEQGLTGFLGPSATYPAATPSGYTGSISSLYGTNLESYNGYSNQVYDEDGNLLAIVDPSWAYMPPPVLDPHFNEIAARIPALPDEEGVISGAPLLMEALFNLSWEESYFNWDQTAGATGISNMGLWTWETVGRREYIDMRWTVSRTGSPGFNYDSGRKPIDEFVVQTQGATAFSIPGVVTVDVSGGSIVAVNINNPGYGYTASPTVYIPGPDLTGTTATISLSVSSGHISGATWTGGTGYSYAPTITVSPPPDTYEEINKVLHAVALPYEGEYDVALYTYDITNGYTVEYSKYKALNKTVDFVSISRKETPQRAWEEFDKIGWEDVTGPWYYPIQDNGTTWNDSSISWESLNFSSYKNQSLFEFPLVTSILSINRESRSPSILLSGDLTGNISNGLTLNVGDFIFLTRTDPSPVVTNLKLPVDSFAQTLQGLSGGLPYSAILTGATGSTSVSTTLYDTTNYLKANDSIWVSGDWYKVSSVGSTSLSLVSPLLKGLTGNQALTYSSSLVVPSGYTSSSPFTMKRYSRVLVTSNCDYSTLDPTVDTYDYLNGINVSGSTINFTSTEDDIQKLMVKNSSLAGNSDLYASWGIFSGTYALEITNISKTTSNNTLLRLKDPNKELYYLDGNFDVRLSDYDVDYAETKIGAEAFKFENMDEFTWDENPGLTWYGAEFHGGANCGYTIPFVSPGGTITVDENDTFVFSGNSSINNTKSGISVATQELNDSTNIGISKYYYEALPQDPLFMLSTTGASVSVSSNVAIGATSIPISGKPSGNSLKIPAELSVTLSGTSVSSVTIVNPGYGYSKAPTVTVSSPGCTGTIATITCTMAGLPTEGYISSVTFTGGTGYSAVPTVTVDFPDTYQPYDNYLWSGSEWAEVVGVAGSTAYSLILGDALEFAVPSSSNILMPYEFHKQQYLNPTVFQQFYYFIQGKAKNESSEMLSYINFSNGVSSEWAAHPDRTNTYPLNNSYLNLGLYGTASLSEDYLYNKWISEGADYPPLNVYPDYSSDVLSYESRIPFSSTVQSSFSFIDTVISNNQLRMAQFSTIVFNFDNCSIPGKNSPMWTIKDDSANKILAMSTEDKLMWSFTRPGAYSVSLQIKDSNGNVATGEKKSFIVIE